MMNSYQTITQNQQANTTNSMFRTIKDSSSLDPFLKGEYGSLIVWKALEIVSEGSSCTIYKALDLNEGKIFAVKKYNNVNDNKDYEAFTVRLCV